MVHVLSEEHHNRQSFLVLVLLNLYRYCATMVRMGLVRLLLVERRREYRTSNGLAKGQFS